MAQLTCGCLNVRLQIKESPQSLVPRVPDLTPQENQHPFFSKDVWLVTLSIGGITEGQKFLVRRCLVGGWTVHECLNCHIFTHATKAPSDPVAASTHLIVDVNRIEMLQRCEGYSPVFNLVLPTSLDNRPLPPNSPTDFSNNRSPETEEALRAIQQQMSKFLKKAESQAESNIRAYTEKQQTALAALQVRARRDRQTLMRMLSSVQASVRFADDDPLATFEMDGASGRDGRASSFTFTEPQELRMGLEEEVEEAEEAERLRDETEGDLPPLLSAQPRSSQPVSVNPTVQAITGGVRGLRLSSSLAMPKVKPQGNVRVAQSLDTEGLFDMDGMVMDANVMPAQPTNYQSDDDDTDDSNHDEGIHIPGNRLAGMRDLAQSVPVNVPMWPTQRATKQPREPVVIERPRDSSQMAASIQALARSVHTTSVDLFGDLPRPRQPT